MNYGLLLLIWQHFGHFVATMIHYFLSPQEVANGLYNATYHYHTTMFVFVSNKNITVVYLFHLLFIIIIISPLY
jgi:hypothetical protein